MVTKKIVTKKVKWKVFCFYLFLEFRVEDLKYVKDDPLLDSTYRGFVQVKANLRKRKDWLIYKLTDKTYRFELIF